jgi:hypothetical protein
VSDDRQCSGCPVRDLGTIWPPGDPRDPWRRWPDVFAELVDLFGPAMMNRSSRTRLRIERLIRHYSDVQRSKAGLCTRRRSRVCHDLILDAVRHARTAPTKADRYAYITQALRRLVNDEETHALMLATRPPVTQAAPDLSTFRLPEVPAA